MDFSSFANTQYQPCPSHAQNHIPVERQQSASDRQDHHNVTAHPEGELDLMLPDDNSAANSLPIKAQTASGANGPSVLDIVDPEKYQSTQSSLHIHLGWKASWRTQTVILGFFVLSSICAGIHVCFFMYLDGRILSESIEISEKKTHIPQGYVTTISLLITAAFRAALLASVGVCYTQYLWATLRERALKVGLIEDLFQIQTNAFHLGSPELYLKTPVLAAVALFCWLVPIATVYPPGALTVELRVASIDTNFNVSVFHVEDPTRDTNTLSHIWCGSDDDVPGPAHSWGSKLKDQTLLETCGLDMPVIHEDFYANAYDARYITISSLISGEIASLPQPAEGNSSYELLFWGVSLDCENTTHFVEKKVEELYPDFQTWSSYVFMTNGLTISTDPLYLAENTSIVYRIAKRQEEFRYYPCSNSNDGALIRNNKTGRVTLPYDGIHVLAPVNDVICHPKIVQYSATISHFAGRQNISVVETNTSSPSYSSKFRYFNGSYAQWVQLSDAMTVYDELSQALGKSETYEIQVNLEYQVSQGVEMYLNASNGTPMATCSLKTTFSPFPSSNSSKYEVWPLTVFPRRLGETGDAPAFDVQLANEVLLNTTISMLSLNRRFGIVNGTTSRTVNIYQFRGKLAFFLPYGICLGFGIPIIASGLIALFVRNQGVSAITGGFVQLLMTTTGRTSLEAIVAKSTGMMGGYESVSEELKELKIRFGELIEDDHEGDGGTARSGMMRCSSPYGNHSSDSGSAQDITVRQNDSSERSSSVEIPGSAQTRRFGFGLAKEVRPLSMRNVS